MSRKPFRPLPRQEMAALLGVQLRTFRDLEARRALTPLQRGRGGQPSTYDVTRTVRDYIAYKVRETPRDRLYKLQGDKVELEVKARAGELLEASTVEAEWAVIALAVKRAVLALPGRLLQLGHIPIDRLGPVTEECADVLRHLGKSA